MRNEGQLACNHWAATEYLEQSQQREYIAHNLLPSECRQRGYDLKHAVDAWQAKNGVERVLTTGFLDGTHPIVDTYELKVRVGHAPCMHLPPCSLLDCLCVDGLS